MQPFFIPVILDLKGVGLSHFHGPAMKMISRTFSIDEAHYPENLRKVYVINLPGLFSLFWNFLKPFLDPK